MRVCLCVCGICSMRASTHTMHSLREGFMMSRVQCCLWLFEKKKKKKKRKSKKEEKEEEEFFFIFPKSKMCVCV